MTEKQIIEKTVLFFEKSDGIIFITMISYQLKEKMAHYQFMTTLINEIDGRQGKQKPLELIISFLWGAVMKTIVYYLE